MTVIWWRFSINICGTSSRSYCRTAHFCGVNSGRKNRVHRRSRRYCGNSSRIGQNWSRWRDRAFYSPVVEFQNIYQATVKRLNQCKTIPHPLIPPPLILRLPIFHFTTLPRWIRMHGMTTPLRKTIPETVRIVTPASDFLIVMNTARSVKKPFVRHVFKRDDFANNVPRMCRNIIGSVIPRWIGFR